MRCGCGKSLVRFTKNCFPTTGENYTGIHDMPRIHCFLLGKYAILVMDLVNGCNFDLRRQEASEILNLPVKNIWVHANHSLATPHLDHDHDELSDCITKAVQEACQNALHHTFEGSAGWGTTKSMINVNRVVELNEGCHQGSNENGRSNHTVPILKITNENQMIQGVLYFVNTASGVLEGSRSENGDRLVSGDIAACSSRYIEKQFDCSAAYCISASGDQWTSLRAIQDTLNPDGTLTTSDLHETGFELVNLLGTRLGSNVANALNHIECKPVQNIHLISKMYTYPGQKELGRNPALAKPVHSLPFEKSEDVTSDVTLMIIDDSVLIAGHNEICVETLENILKESPYQYTVYMGFTNQAEGYLVTADLYDRCSVQCRKSKYAKGGAELYERNVIDLLKESRKKWKY